MTSRELKSLLDSKEILTLLDVREENEREFAKISPSEWVPMGQIPEKMDDLNQFKSSSVVVYCHHGIRSAHVVSYLRANGFDSVHNLEGGIESWSIEIDPSVPRY